jgi:hypothetical protein
MNASDVHVHKNFHKILAAALGTLGLTYCFYGMVFYLKLGQFVPVNISIDFSAENIGGSTINNILNILYFINLYFSLPSAIYPVS